MKYYDFCVIFFRVTLGRANKSLWTIPMLVIIGSMMCSSKNFACVTCPVCLLFQLDVQNIKIISQFCP